MAASNHNNNNDNTGGVIASRTSASVLWGLARTRACASDVSANFAEWNDGEVAATDWDVVRPRTGGSGGGAAVGSAGTSNVSGRASQNKAGCSTPRRRRQTRQGSLSKIRSVFEDPHHDRVLAPLVRTSVWFRVGDLVEHGHVSPIALPVVASPDRIAHPEKAVGTIGLPQGLATNHRHKHTAEWLTWIVSELQTLPLSVRPWDQVWPKSEKGQPRYNQSGLYIVKLFWLGAWRQVQVDDRMPLDVAISDDVTSVSVFRDALLTAVSTCTLDDKSGSAATARAAPLELWPLLLSKAIFKLARVGNQGLGFHRFGGTSVVQMLTGWVPRQLLVPRPLEKQRGSDKELSQLHPEAALWDSVTAHMEQRNQKDTVVTATLAVIDAENHVGINAESERRRVGLVCTHTHSCQVSNAVEVVDSKNNVVHRLVHVHSPFVSWSGPCSYDDQGVWTPKLQALLDINRHRAAYKQMRLHESHQQGKGHQPFDFWMSFEDFCCHFSAITLYHGSGEFSNSQTHRATVEQRKEGSRPMTLFGGLQFSQMAQAKATVSGVSGSSGEARPKAKQREAKQTKDTRPAKGGSKSGRRKLRSKRSKAARTGILRRHSPAPLRLATVALMTEAARECNLVICFSAQSNTSPVTLRSHWARPSGHMTVENWCPFQEPEAITELWTAASASCIIKLSPGRQLFKLSVDGVRALSVIALSDAELSFGSLELLQQSFARPSLLIEKRSVQLLQCVGEVVASLNMSGVRSHLLRKLCSLLPCGHPDVAHALATALGTMMEAKLQHTDQDEVDGARASWARFCAFLALQTSSAGATSAASDGTKASVRALATLTIHGAFRKHNVHRDGGGQADMTTASLPGEEQKADIRAAIVIQGWWRTLSAKRRLAHICAGRTARVVGLVRALWKMHVANNISDLASEVFRYVLSDAASRPVVKATFPGLFDTTDASLECSEYNGQYSLAASGTVGFLFRETFTVQETVKVHMWLQVTPQSTDTQVFGQLRIINNDSLDEQVMPSVFGQPAMDLTLHPNKAGYTFLGDVGVVGPYPKQGLWKLLLTAQGRAPQPTHTPLTQSLRNLVVVGTSFSKRPLNLVLFRYCLCSSVAQVVSLVVNSDQTHAPFVVRLVCEDTLLYESEPTCHRFQLPAVSLKPDCQYVVEACVPYFDEDWLDEPGLTPELLNCAALFGKSVSTAPAQPTRTPTKAKTPKQSAATGSECEQLFFGKHSPVLADGVNWMVTLTCDDATRDCLDMVPCTKQVEQRLALKRQWAEANPDRKVEAARLRNAVLDGTHTEMDPTKRISRTMLNRSSRKSLRRQVFRSMPTCLRATEAMDALHRTRALHHRSIQHARQQYAERTRLGRVEAATTSGPVTTSDPPPVSLPEP
eukprot:m.442320 g.442320  ORF g.442320 m.442320 type:complete len:1379 (-) comp20286_c2_seq15:127-4263(-)